MGRYIQRQICSRPRLLDRQQGVRYQSWRTCQTGRKGYILLTRRRILLFVCAPFLAYYQSCRRVIGTPPFYPSVSNTIIQLDNLLTQVITRAFNLEYRRSTSDPYPESFPFPAALLDAVAGYNYLVNTVGFEPANIVVVGDSAGGNLTLSLTRYLVEHQDSPDAELPARPGQILLFSPWCDLSASHDTPGSSSSTNVDSDYVGTSTCTTNTYAKRSFLGPHGFTAAELNPYISPASKHTDMKVSFKGFPKTMIIAGEAETLFDQIVTLRDRMAKDLGETVTYYQGQDAIHDYVAFEFFEPQRSDTLQAVAKWLSRDI